jgi:DNA-directed RNA polymerase specialized sigma24 family protein
LRNLPTAHREILAATYFRRQTTRQAARQLGITPDDAKLRLYLATRELAAIVGTARHQGEELTVAGSERGAPAR